ncbi:MAG: hypothetical protein NTX79_08820 [Candidatus Micrarchaeota archaeon]|nr:hypothetical protein [Candidatus Micrarchaeota archaeon]
MGVLDKIKEKNLLQKAPGLAALFLVICAPFFYGLRDILVEKPGLILPLFITMVAVYILMLVAAYLIALDVKKHKVPWALFIASMAFLAILALAGIYKAIEYAMKYGIDGSFIQGCAFLVFLALVAMLILRIYRNKMEETSKS